MFLKLADEAKYQIPVSDISYWSSVSSGQTSAILVCCRQFLNEMADFRCSFIPSEDYAYNFVQWQIGVGSMWSEAIGLAPLKDRCPTRNIFSISSIQATLKGYISLDTCPAWGSHGRWRPRRYFKRTLSRLAFCCFPLFERNRAPQAWKTVRTDRGDLTKDRSSLEIESATKMNI